MGLERIAGREAAAARVREALAGIGPCLAVFIGPAGAGKSFLAREVARGPGQVLSLDRLRGVVSGDESDQSATQDAVRALHLLAAARLGRKLTTIIDATNVEPSARRALLTIAARARVPAVAIVMTAPLETCLARNQRRPGPPPGARWGRRVPEAIVRAQHRQLHASLPVLTTEGFARLVLIGEEDGATRRTW
jgi:predicted kinase